MEVDGGDAAAAATATAVAADGPPRCGICWEEEEGGAPLHAQRCGHAFCGGCWSELLRVALEGGASCVHARCPEPGCAEPIAGETWAALLPAAYRPAWRLLLVRSFVGANALLARCPSAGCAALAALVIEAAPADVHCGCGAEYCALCGEGAHFPATCARRKAWHGLMHTSPDGQFLLQHTRPCPSCGARTQRDKGCMHIRCTICSQEWCWACGQKGKGVHHAFECNRRPVT